MLLSQLRRFSNLHYVILLFVLCGHNKALRSALVIVNIAKNALKSSGIYFTKQQKREEKEEDKSGMKLPSLVAMIMGTESECNSLAALDCIQLD